MKALAKGCDEAAPPPRKKYIVFAGNLPYETSSEDLSRFFADCRPKSIRFMMDRVTQKPKGFAFVEFSDSASLEGALALHHHKLKGRKVNVELTAGGGGSKSVVRRQRIKDKNQRLNEEREGASKGGQGDF